MRNEASRHQTEARTALRDSLIFPLKKTTEVKQTQHGLSVLSAPLTGVRRNPHVVPPAPLPISRTGHPAKLKLSPLNTASAPPPPPNLAPAFVLSVSINLTSLSTSHKWNHTVCVLLCLAVS